MPLAALLTENNKPLELAEVEPCALSAGQVLVKILVSGICGKQLAEIRGDQDSNAPRPRLIGHEASGIVLECGWGVTKVKVGDKVCCHWRKSSGMDSPFPQYAIEDRTFTSGRIATFAEQAIISENRLTKVPSDTPDELVMLLGCGLSTALGVMENEAQLKAGESVLIVGCGGVGLNLIRVAKMMGASRVVGRDQGRIFGKLQTALDTGCHDVECTDGADMLETFDVIVDTTGSPMAIAAAIPRLNSGGTFVMVGQPKEGAQILLYAARHMFDGEGKRIIATQGGQFSPDKDISRYIKMWKSGHLRIDGIVTHRYPFLKINEALDAVRSGNAGRVILEMV